MIAPKLKSPSFKYEETLSKTAELIFGIDEVGRGSFAGPLVAAAVYFKKEYKWFEDVNDSKLLTHKKRVKLSKLIQKNATYFIEIIDIDLINKLGIEKCNKIVFENLINTIKNEFKDKEIYFLIDGKDKNLMNKQTEFIVKGDQKHISISAASIIAKVYRDNLMKDFGKIYPGYNFSRNKGYGTKFHRKALKIYGLSQIHRKSFNLRKFL